MKEFICVLKNEYDEVVLFGIQAPNRQSLYNSDKSLSPQLIDCLLGDSYNFIGYSRENLEKCKLLRIEEKANIIYRKL